MAGIRLVERMKYAIYLKMSYPNATIYNIENKYVKIDYQDTEHYQIVKSFINNTNGMTLLKEKDNGKEKTWE